MDENHKRGVGTDFLPFHGNLILTPVFTWNKMIVNLPLSKLNTVSASYHCFLPDCKRPNVTVCNTTVLPK